MTDAKPSSENAANPVAASPVIRRLPASATLADVIDASLEVNTSGALVLGDSADTRDALGQSLESLSDGEIVARCVPMTDAIKRVDGNLVRGTVDRSQLRVVAFPVVIPVVLARKWAETLVAEVDARPGSAGVVDLARLLSELSTVEPDLVVIDVDNHVREPNS